MSKEVYPVYLAEPGRQPTLPPEGEQFECCNMPASEDARYRFVYCLMNDETVVYVGQTVNLFSRVGDHAKSKIFDRVFWFKCRAQDVDFIEKALIKYYKPPKNNRDVEGGLSYDQAHFLESKLGLTVEKPGRSKRARISSR